MSGFSSVCTGADTKDKERFRVDHSTNPSLKRDLQTSTSRSSDPTNSSTSTLEINLILDLLSIFGNGPSTYFEAKALAKKLLEEKMATPQPLSGLALIKFRKKPSINEPILPPSDKRGT